MARKSAVLAKKSSKSKMNQPVPLEEMFKKRLLELTDREREVLKLFSRGFTYQEIGEKLDISPKTVGSYLQRVREKFRAKSRSALMTLALKEDLVSDK